MAVTVFLILGALFTAVVQLAWFSGRMAATVYHGLMAVLNAVYGVVAVLHGWTVMVYLAAGCTALSAWWWWNSGGGDGTKRRLKRWARRFQGVRRTAPQGV